MVDIGPLLMEGMAETVKSIDTIQEVEEAFRISLKNGDDYHGTQVNLHSIMRKFGTQDIRRSIGTYEIQLRRLENEAADVVAKEQKKSLIFAGKRPPSTD